MSHARLLLPALLVTSLAGCMLPCTDAPLQPSRASIVELQPRGETLHLDERALVEALYFRGMTMHAFAEEQGVHVSTVSRRHAQALRESIVAMIRPLMVLGVLALLLLMEPDFGATMVIIAVALGLVFLGGVNFWQFSAMQLLVVGGMAVLLWSSPYRRARLSSFLNPWEDPFNKGFQLTQSLIAIGRGEFDGVGLGASVQKLFYLPEAYTDFIFAIIAEELGLLGVLCVLATYLVIVVRSFQVGARCERLRQPFGASVAYGIGLWIGFQALINMGVNLGVLPTKGLTLPFISYGGSSLVVMCIAYAILLRVDAESRLEEDPKLRRDRLLAKVRAP